MSVIRRNIQVAWPLRVFFTENVFAPDNSTLRDALADVASRKVFVVLEDSLSQARPELEHQIEKYFVTHAQLLPLVRPPLFVSGGEPPSRSSPISWSSSTGTISTGTRISSPSAAARCWTWPGLPPRRAIAACGSCGCPPPP